MPDGEDQNFGSSGVPTLSDIGTKSCRPFAFVKSWSAGLVLKFWRDDDVQTYSNSAAKSVRGRSLKKWAGITSPEWKKNVYSATLIVNHECQQPLVSLHLKILSPLESLWQTTRTRTNVSLWRVLKSWKRLTFEVSERSIYINRTSLSRTNDCQLSSFVLQKTKVSRYVDCDVVRNPWIRHYVASLRQIRRGWWLKHILFLSYPAELRWTRIRSTHSAVTMYRMLVKRQASQHECLADQPGPRSNP